MHTLQDVDWECDPAKEMENVRKHGVGFQEAAESLISATLMRKQYDFSKAKRGAILRESNTAGKTRITIRLDNEVLEWFERQAGAAGGGRTYQGMINAALREHIAREREPLEATLRRVVREELRRHK